MDEKNIVKCSKCGKAHEMLWPNSPTQGNGCASSVVINDKYNSIFSTYGSDFDLLKHDFINNHNLKNEDLVCDKCIQLMIDDKIIKNDEDYVGMAL